MADGRGMLGDSWAFTKALGEGAWDAGAGILEGLGDLAKGGYKLATDEKARESAWETTKQLAETAEDYSESVIDDPGKAYRDAKDGTLTAYDRFEKAKDLAAAEGRSAEFFGDMAGSAIFEVGTILIPAGLAAKAGKLGKVASIADEVADTGKKAKKIENAEDVFGPANKAKSVSASPVIKELDDKVSPIEKCSVADCDSIGVNNLPLSQAKIDEIISIPKGKRPLPEEYLSADYIKNHLSQFDEGSARLASKKAIKKFGTAGPSPSYVMPKPYLDKVIKEANGDIGKIEEALGIPKGSWDPDDIVVVEIPPTKDIKMPSGNERGANEMWKPGGVTSGGVPEAVTKLRPLDKSTIKPLFGE